MKNNRPEGDVWNLRDADEKSQFYRKNFKFDFTYIESDEIKDTVKDYIWQNYKTRNKTLNTLYHHIKLFIYFNSFAISKKISSFKELTNTDIDYFLSYLHTTIADRTNRPLGYQSQKKILDCIKSIIHWGYIHKPDVVPEAIIFTGNEYTGVNRKLKIEFIPDDVLININKALSTEVNPYIRYGIIILESTGMRVGDLLKLRTDCIKPHLISGYTISWTDHKSRKERAPLPVRSECAVAVEKLIEATKDIREQADERVKKYLFINKKKGRFETNGDIDVIADESLSMLLSRFIRENNIRDSDGKLYNLTSHQFRRTLATDMLSKGFDITLIQEVLGHSDPSVTKQAYADVKDKERAEIFSKVGVIGNINMLDKTAFDNAEEMKWFKANKDKEARMCDGYCTKPVKDGRICDRLLKRQKCYTCSRYITTPEFLEVHKSHLASLENQIEDGSIYGEHYAEHFRPTIEVLKIIIERLEGLQNVRK